MQNNIVSHITGLPYSYSYKVLPLVYDEALSYWEQIVLFTGKVNELVEYYNQIQNKWETGDSATLQSAKQYADEITAGLQTEFNQLENKITKQISNLELEQNIFVEEQKQYFETSFTHLKNQINADLTILNESLSELWLAMNYLFYQQDEYFKKTGDVLKKYIDDSIPLLNGNRIQIYNPVTNTITSLIQALDDILNYIDTIGSITMREYDSLVLTMEEYDNMQITMRDYQLRAYFIFFKRLEFGEYFESVDNRFDSIESEFSDYKEKNKTYSPWTGKKQDVSKVLSQFINVYQTSPQFEQYNQFTQKFNEFKTYNNLQLTMKKYEEFAIIKYVLQNLDFENSLTIYKQNGYINKNVCILNIWINITEQKSLYYITINDNYFKKYILESSIIITPIYPNTTNTEKSLSYWFAQIENNEIHLETNNPEMEDNIINIAIIFYIREDL